jgi:hypothetical protein
MSTSTSILNISIPSIARLSFTQQKSLEQEFLEMLAHLQLMPQDVGLILRSCAPQTVPDSYVKFMGKANQEGVMLFEGKATTQEQCKVLI